MHLRRPAVVYSGMHKKAKCVDICYFTKSPIISGSCVERDIQLKASYYLRHPAVVYGGCKKKTKCVDSCYFTMDSLPKFSKVGSPRVVGIE